MRMIPSPAATKYGFDERSTVSVENPMIIINADDFGISKEVNRAIIACFHEGVISSATIIANMDGFDEACRLAMENGLCQKIGIHINISEGRPLTTKILRQPRFCAANGEFSFQRNAGFFLTRTEKAALTEECEAQMKRCLDMGLALTHLDSHHHVHTEWAVFSVIRPLIRKYGIKFVRPARNDNVRNSVLKGCYKTLFNVGLSQMALRRTLFFGDLEGFKAMWARHRGGLTSFEIMVHPTLNGGDTIIDRLDGKNIMRVIRDLAKELNLSSFALH
jgi:predicted glycoside hydrolase/deacetylase ChbG (UPF0249 family)